MKKSREFNNILDECLERLLVKGETIEQCLQDFPEQADELEPLLQMALATKKAITIQPRPEFRAEARYQFLSALQRREEKRSRPFFGLRPRWAPVVAIVLALLLAGGGTVAAAGGSMPDEPLYRVKLATEQVQLILTPSALGKAEFYARLADRRVSEIAYMASRNKPEQIEQTAHRLDDYLAKIASLTSTQEVTRDVLMAPAVEEAPLMPKRAEGARIEVNRRARLRATIMHYAVNHPERLRAVLETAPESVRSAILQAIAISTRGYEKALKSLD